MKNIALFCAFLFCIESVAQIIPLERKVDWELAGLGFEIPTPSLIVTIDSFGGAGDNSTYNDTALVNAIASLSGNFGAITFGTGIYLFSSTVNIPDSVVLKGAGANLTTLSFNLGGAGNMIQIHGSTTNIFDTLISGYDKDSIVLMMNTTGYVVGDFVEIRQDGGAYITDSWAETSIGQIAQISSLDAGSITLNHPLRLTYETNLFPRIQKIFPRSHVGIECLKIQREDATTTQTSNIDYNFAAHCWLRGIESNLCNFAHVAISNSTSIEIRGSFFQEAHDWGNGGKAYGVVCHFKTGECLIENNIFKHLRHSMLLQAGANGNVFGYNYSIEPFWTDVSFPIASNTAGDMVLHGNYPYANLFEGNQAQSMVIDDAHGINGPYNTYFRNRADIDGLFMNNSPATNFCNLIGNEITSTAFLEGFYVINGTDNFAYGNNDHDSPAPSGTDDLADVTYYLPSPQPDFLSYSDSIPTIGYPNVLSTGNIPAALRYLNGVDFALCIDTADFVAPIDTTQDTNTTATTNFVQQFEHEKLDHIIFPNPFSSSLHLRLSEQYCEDNFSFHLYNLVGKELLFQNNVKVETTLDTRKLVPGIYMYHLASENKIIGKGKIIKH